MPGRLAWRVNLVVSLRGYRGGFANVGSHDAPRYERKRTLRHSTRGSCGDTMQDNLADLLAFVEREGMVLESARHPAVPNLVEQIVGEPVHGSWWGHPKGHEIYALLNALHEADAEVAVCKFIDGKITYIHRRLWAPCARLAAILGPERLDRVHSVHTDKGHHKLERIPLVEWLPTEVAAAAAELAEDEARVLLDRWLAV